MKQVGMPAVWSRPWTICIYIIFRIRVRWDCICWNVKIMTSAFIWFFISCYDAPMVIFQNRIRIPEKIRILIGMRMEAGWGEEIQEGASWKIKNDLVPWMAACGCPFEGGKKRQITHRYAFFNMEKNECNCMGKTGMRIISNKRRDYAYADDTKKRKKERDSLSARGVSTKL